MSRFVRCDRCDTEDSVIGTLSLPPGWQKICEVDLCESCCATVREFIRFRPSDADRLPVEPIPDQPSGPIPDKLFETAPEPKAELAIQEIFDKTATIVNSGALDTPGVKCTAAVPLDTTPAERQRTRRAKKKLKGKEVVLAVLPGATADKRTSFTHGHNGPGVAQP